MQSEGYGTVALSLWAMNPDGSAQQAIHQNYVDDPLEIVPVWSPDGALIAYTRCAGQLFGCDASQEVWIRNADGSNPRRVTTGTQPSWTPDGKSLIVSDKYQYPTGEPVTQLYRVNLDGSGKTLLTEPDGCGKGFAKVSPQGDRVAFQWSCPYLDKPTGVYAVAIGGGQPVRLTSWTDYERQNGFDWSPDGKRIVYARAPNGFPVPTVDLYVVEVSTGVPTRLTTTDATGPDFPPDEGGPVFSPDGSKIAYHLQGDIWVMNADGSNPRQLTSTTWSETWPSWQPCRAGKSCVLSAPPTPPGPQPPGPQPPAPQPPVAPSSACSDGVDNDGDRKVDYPADPGCSSLADANEVDPSPSSSRTSKPCSKAGTLNGTASRFFTYGGRRHSMRTSIFKASARMLNCPQGVVYGPSPEWRVASTLRAPRVCLTAKVWLTVDFTKGLPSSARRPHIGFRGENLFPVTPTWNRNRTQTWEYETLDMGCSMNTTYRWATFNILYGGLANTAGALVTKVSVRLTGELRNRANRPIYRFSIRDS